MIVPPNEGACTPTHCQAGGWGAIHFQHLAPITEPPSPAATAVVVLLLSVGATAARPLVTTRTDIGSAVGISRRNVSDTLDHLQESGWIVVTRHSGTGTSVHLSDAAVRRLMHPTRSDQAQQRMTTTAIAAPERTLGAELIPTTRENEDGAEMIPTPPTGIAGAREDGAELIPATRENADKIKSKSKSEDPIPIPRPEAETEATAPADPQTGDETPIPDAPGKAASHGGAAADLATGLAGVINAAHPAAAESAGKLAGLWRARGVDVEAALEHARGAGHEDPVAHLLELAASAPWMSWTRPGAGTAKWLTDVVPGLLDGEMALARAQSRQQAQPEPRVRYAAYLADALARVQRGEPPNVAREVLMYELPPDIRSEALAAFDAAVPGVEVTPRPVPVPEIEPVFEPDSYNNRFEDPEFSPDLDLDRYDVPGADETEPLWEPDCDDDCFEDPEPSPDLDLSRYDEPGGHPTPVRSTQSPSRWQPKPTGVRRPETATQRLARLRLEGKQRLEQQRLAGNAASPPPTTASPPGKRFPRNPAATERRERRHGGPGAVPPPEQGRYATRFEDQGQCSDTDLNPATPQVTVPGDVW